jgi:SAM-dependent methyltransferase
MYRINVGCGMTPTRGYLNFDNSFSVRLSAFPKLSNILYKAGLLDQPQMNYIRFCRENEIAWADATRRIPLPDDSTEVVYASHMLEHLDRQEVGRFLAEAKRLLGPGGVIRLAVPDLGKHARSYIGHGDADVFIDSLHVCAPKPRSLAERLRLMLVGPRHHQWMYDGKSLCKLLNDSGFLEARVYPAGETRIVNPGTYDLAERMDESVYVEAIKPCRTVAAPS